MLNKGDVFVFPVGLIHFQFNPNPYKSAVAIAALSSQNPGAITIATAVFGSCRRRIDREERASERGMNTREEEDTGVLCRRTRQRFFYYSCL